MPATLFASPGTEVRAAIVWATAAQVTQLTWSEVPYHFARLDDAHFVMNEADVSVDQIFAFIHRFGSLCVDGSPVALAAIPAEGRTATAFTQEQLLDLLAVRVIGPEARAEDLVRALCEDLAGVVGRALCKDDWTLYCSRDYAERHGVPKSKEDLKNHSLVGGGGGNLWRAYSAWIKELGLEDQVAVQHGSSSGLLSGVRSGFGIAVLPCLVADGDPDLIRCLPPPGHHGRVLWLLTHERVRHAPRVRTTIDFLYERLKALVADLKLAR